MHSGNVIHFLLIPLQLFTNIIFANLSKWMNDRFNQSLVNLNLNLWLMVYTKHLMKFDGLL